VPAEGAPRTLALAVDYCGRLVGEATGDMSATAVKIPGLHVTDPMPIEQLSEEMELRAAFKRALMLEGDQKLQVAAFSLAPSVNSRPFALLNTHRNICVVVDPSDTKGMDTALGASLAAEGSPWSKDADLAEGIPKWTRPAPWGDRAFLAVSIVEGLTRVLIGIEQRPLATREQVANHVRTAVDACVTGILERVPAGTSSVSSAYAEVARLNYPEHPNIDVLRLRSTTPGPISVLEVRSLEGESLCELFTSDALVPADAMLSTVNSLLAELPKAKAVRVKAKGDVPAHDAWRIRRAGNTRSAEISAERDTEDEHMVIVTIKRHGWFLF
jgi:hypothetical protein